MKSTTELAGGELCLPQRPHNQVGAARRRSVHFSNVNMFKNRIVKYILRASYSLNSVSGLSISQWLPCLMPSKVFLGWQLSSNVRYHKIG